MTVTKGAIIHQLLTRIEKLEHRVAELEKPKRTPRKTADSEK